MIELAVATSTARELVDVTDAVVRAAAELGLADGALLVSSPHTTAGVIVNEGYDPDVAGDLVRRLERLAPRDGPGRPARRGQLGRAPRRRARRQLGAAADRRQRRAARSLAAHLPRRVGRPARAPPARLARLAGRDGRRATRRGHRARVVPRGASGSRSRRPCCSRVSASASGSSPTRPTRPCDGRATSRPLRAIPRAGTTSTDPPSSRSPTSCTPASARRALLDAVRAELGRATAARLPRVESVLRELVAPPGDDPLRHLAALLRGAVRPRARRRRGADKAQGRLLALAVACQTSVSIVQWGLGALGPDLARSYGLSAAGLGALVSATAIGNAVALVGAGVAVDRYGTRLPLIVGGVGTGVLLAVGGYAPGVAALAVCAAALGRRRLADLGRRARSRCSTASPPTVAARRSACVRCRSPPVGSSPRSCCPGSPRSAASALALGACGALTLVTSVAFGLASPAGALHARAEGARVFDMGGVLRTPGMLRLHDDRVPVRLLADGGDDVHRAGREGVRALDRRCGGAVRRRLARGDGGARSCSGGSPTCTAAAAGGRRCATSDCWRPSAASSSGSRAARASPSRSRPSRSSRSARSASTASLYAIAGELVGPRRAGQAVGLAATVLFGGSAIGAVPLGMLADAAGYRALWPAAAVLTALGTFLALRLPRPAPQLP